MEAFSDTLILYGDPLVPIPILPEDVKTIGHDIYSRFGVHLKVLDGLQPIHDDSGKVVIPKISAGLLELRPFGLRRDQESPEENWSHAMLCSLYGLLDCLAVYDDPELPETIIPPTNILGEVHPRTFNLSKRLGFKEVARTSMLVNGKRIERHLVKGDLVEVQERAGDFIFSLPEKIHERLAREAAGQFPEFWRDPVSAAVCLPRQKVSISLKTMDERAEAIYEAQRQSAIWRGVLRNRAEMVAFAAIAGAGAYEYAVGNTFLGDVGLGIGIGGLAVKLFPRSRISE